MEGIFYFVFLSDVVNRWSIWINGLISEVCIMKHIITNAQAWHVSYAPGTLLSALRG